MRAAAPAALVLAAACAAPAPDRPTPIPAAQGLDVGATGLEIGFGRTEASTIDAVAFLLDRPPDARGPAPGCAGSLARWDAAGLTLYFIDGDFVGWRLRPGTGAPPNPAGLDQAGRTCGPARP
jgi:hypothetical protein